MAPVKAPFSWPNNSLSSSPVGDSRTIQFDERTALARAEVVNGAGDELLARAGFAPNEHRGAGGGDRLHLLENAAEGGAIPDDLPEVVLGADFLLQVGVRFGELVPQRLDLLEGQGVLNRHSDLVGNELQVAQIRCLIGERLLARENQDAQPPPGCSERQIAGTLDPKPLRSFEGSRPALFLGHVREDPRLLGLPDRPCRVLFKRKNWRGRKRYGLGALQNMRTHGVARCFVQGKAEIIEAHHLMEPACQLMEQRG